MKISTTSRSVVDKVTLELNFQEARVLRALLAANSIQQDLKAVRDAAYCDDISDHDAGDIAMKLFDGLSNKLD